jgi:hypothetical protein
VAVGRAQLLRHAVARRSDLLVHLQRQQTRWALTLTAGTQVRNGNLDVHIGFGEGWHADEFAPKLMISTFWCKKG